VNVLDLPAEMAVRWIALGLLAEAAAAHARLADPADTEALHDFRVALRRLRSTLRAYRDLPGDVVRGKDRRVLRELARATGGARDAQVQNAWLTARLKKARGAERIGLRGALERSRERSEAAGEQLRGVAAAFPEEHERLARRLGRFCTELEPGAAPGGTPFRAELAARLRSEADALALELEGVLDESRQDEAHRARIAAKRIRYLLEPVRDLVPGAAGMIKELKGLQALLGEMHDAHILLGEVSAAAFPGRVRALADELEGTGPPREIERKYLLRKMPALDGLEAELRQIEQGYLPGERLAERVRSVKTDSGTRWYRTVKLGSGVSRIEVEEETTDRIFGALWRLTKGRRVRKRRYAVRDGDLLWEIDHFRGRRLVLAEVELPAENAPVEIPEWLRPVLVREVTGDPAYVNLNLAR
jgi:CHAD domain-containing protein/CYTH domain-containing protein